MIDLMDATEISFKDWNEKSGDVLNTARHRGLKEILQLIGETVFGLTY